VQLQVDLSPNISFLGVSLLLEYAWQNIIRCQLISRTYYTDLHGSSVSATDKITCEKCKTLTMLTASTQVQSYFHPVSKPELSDTGYIFELKNNGFILSVGRPT
jgi:hypothetical protein